ncbi:MAG: SnoaL-like domain-containing protein [Phycisphaerales bacterium]
MSTATTNVRERLDDLIDYIRTGRIMEAMTEFYDENVVMEEPAYGKTVGLKANIEREQKFVDGVKAWKGFEVTGIGAGEDVTFYEHTMDFVTQDGTEVHVEQVAVAKWKDGKIIHERFYYNMN